MTKTNQKIPEGWSVKKLGDICYINRYSLTEKTEKEYKFKYIDLSSVNKGNIAFPDNYISFKDAPSRARRIIHKNDIIMSTVRPNLQSFAIIDFIPSDFICSTGFAVLTAKEKTSNKYIYQLLYSKEIETQINNMLVGSNYPAINSSDVASLKLHLPPLCEQEKIAEILGTWDTAIEKLSALIEQKKRLKKGLMQRLLTGKQRLPGFSAPWKKVKLGEITDQISKSVGNLKIQTASISAKIGFVPQTEKFGRDISGEQYSKYTLIEKGDFSYNKGNSKTYPQGCAYRLKDFEKIAVSNVFISFKAKEDILCPEFIEQFFIGNFHGRLLRNVITSSVRDNGLLNLNVKDFFGIPIYLPPLPEQKAIADILSKADEEIDLLTRKLSALKTQKTGLMQKLLTGQIRVKAA